MNKVIEFLLHRVEHAVNEAGKKQLVLSGSSVRVQTSRSKKFSYLVTVCPSSAVQWCSALYIMSYKLLCELTSAIVKTSHFVISENFVKNVKTTLTHS